MAVRFDKEAARAEVVVRVPDGELVISLDPMANLVMHTLNMYGLLGQHGGGYSLSRDKRAQEAVNREIFDRVQVKSATSVMALNLYSPTIETLVQKRLYTEHPDNESLLGLFPVPLDDALRGMWGSFYREYWSSNIDRLYDEFEEMDQQMNWAEMLHRMEKVTQTKWRGSMLVLAVEATGWSALTWGDSVCIGTVDRNGDAGFVHEGLHLLLRERWAEDPAIQRFMAGKEFSDSCWRSWKAKYEQALVVALDARLRNWPHEHVRRYFEGCQVGDLYDLVWPKVCAYVDRTVIPVPELMLEIIQCNEGQG